MAANMRIKMTMILSNVTALTPTILRPLLLLDAAELMSVDAVSSSEKRSDLGYPVSSCLGGMLLFDVGTILTPASVASLLPTPATQTLGRTTPNSLSSFTVVDYDDDFDRA
jgi:hypothetical protein